VKFKKLFNLLEVLINAEHYGLVLASRLKKGYHQIWEANPATFGTNLTAFINILTSMF
jgi:DNA-binding PadR family transcriptional regulator